jgi:DNA modification methylase
MINTMINGDCLEVMQDIPAGSIDMILCDLPYGTTASKWDILIPFDQLWSQYERIIKPNGAIVLFASQPFTTDLINSNRKLFQYELIWEKSRTTGFLQAQKRPMKIHENILVFYKRQPIYNPLKFTVDEKYWDKRSAKARVALVNRKQSTIFNLPKTGNYEMRVDDGSRYPESILVFPSIWGKGMHASQKPTYLYQYLIKTFTNEGDLVLDNCSGSGTNAVACINTKRNYICIEKDKEIFDFSVNRVNQRLSIKEGINAD